MSKRLNFTTVIAWLSLNLFFMYIYALRVSSGIMFAQLRSEFCMTGEQFGIFGACYLYSYSLAQVPMGVLLDRVGVRVVSLFSLILCLVATYILAHAYHLWWAYVSRALLGLGSAAVLMSSLKYASDNMPESYRGIFMGASLSIGVLGAIMAGQGIPDLLMAHTWREILMFAIYGGVPLIFLLAMYLPKHTPQTHKTSEVDSISAVILRVISHRHIMLYGFLSIGVYTPLAVLADLWGPSYFALRFGWDTSMSAQTTMLMYLGLVAGSSLLPWISRMINNYNLVIQVATAGIFAGFCLVLYGPPLTYTTVVVILLALGMLCGAEMLCFTGATHYTTDETSGTTIGVVNTFNMLGGAMLSQLIGSALDWSWSGLLADGLRVYEVKDFTYALSTMVFAVGVCVVASFFLQKPGKDLVKAPA